MNYARDFANNTDLSLAGWRVIRIWECEIKTKSRREETLEKLYRTIVNYDGSAHLGKIKNYYCPLKLESGKISWLEH